MAARRKAPRSNLSDTSFAKQIDRLLTEYGRRERAKKTDEVPRRAAPPLAKGEVREVPFNIPFAEATRRWQRQRVLDALEAHVENGTWNISASSRSLGLPRSQVYRLMRRLRIRSRREQSRRR
jgi:transcriptional regulator of acetoin/glycerol metabolism